MVNGKHPRGQGTPGPPTTVILFGATGDLARRKLLPGMIHLWRSGLLPELRVVGTSLDQLERDDFIEMAREAVEEFSDDEQDKREFDEFAKRLFWANAGVDNLKAAIAEAESDKTVDHLRLHYLSVPPKAALSVVRQLQDADLVTGSRIIMEKPFGTDLASAQALNASIHEVFDEAQIFRIDHFLGKEAALNILALRFANGLFEPIWHRNFIDHVQIDIPEKIGLEGRAAFYEGTGAFKDMVVTHLFQVMAFIAMEAPTALDPLSITEEKNKVFRSMLPLDPHQVVRGQYDGYRTEPGVSPDSETETFIALKCYVDNWRWADVPFYLRTGKAMAEGQRIISIAFKEPPKSMFPEGSGIGDDGPDHLTFDLSDQSKVSLSFYGKRPGPGFRLNKLSMQFAMEDTDWAGSILEAYERLILEAVKGNHTLFTTSEGVERLWEISQPLLDNPPPVRRYAPDSWGPNQIHQLIAPFAWRLPFERKWRD
jgi:glucose-6-phosphate 1-dehydrogenase